MKLYKALACATLLPILLGCTPAGADDSIECTLEIEYMNQVYTASDRDDTKPEAHREALEEACELACKDVDSCERECVKTGVVKSEKCMNLITKEEII
ncbi:MAG: hypothetical protein IKY83_02935 [Proteobacteria bacterium]|nr:hypothetical protein [Pseudomonadota bacterium]